MQFLYKDTPIFFTYQGKGPCLLLLHGFLEDASIWDRYVTDLSKNFTVVTLDLPGHGSSGVVTEVHTMELMADVVFSLLNSLGISVTAVLGHSMGGYVALAMAESNTDIFSHLILLNSRASSDNPSQQENRNRALTLMETHAELFIKTAILNLFNETAKQQYSIEIEQLQQKALTYPKQGIIANIKGMRDRLDRTNILKRFPKDKWVLAGREDPVIPLLESKKLSQYCNAKLEILEGSHMGWLENYAEIVKKLHLIDKF